MAYEISDSKAMAGPGQATGSIPVAFLAMTDWILQGSGRGKRHDLDAALAESPLRSWRTPRYRDRTVAGDRVWVQVVGRDAPGIYYMATILAPTYEDPE